MEVEIKNRALKRGLSSSATEFTTGVYDFSFRRDHRSGFAS